MKNYHTAYRIVGGDQDMIDIIDKLVTALSKGRIEIEELTHEEFTILEQISKDRQLDALTALW